MAKKIQIFVFLLGVIWFWVFIVWFIFEFRQLFAEAWNNPMLPPPHLPDFIMYAVILNFVFMISYWINIIRNSKFDSHKKLTWAVGIALFPYIVAPLYWYKFILHKNST